MKNLAIRGDKERGNEVIALLEMLGGHTDEFIDNGIDEKYAYFIVKDENNVIDAFQIDEKDEFDFEAQIFTIEEFYEKYPYKVGDKVVYTKFGYNCDDYPVTIESMKWTGTTIEYTFYDCVTCLAKDLKMWNGEPDEVISGIYLNSCDYADEVELNLGDYEIEVRDGKTYAVKKKPKYPKNFDDCFNTVADKLNDNKEVEYFEYKYDLLDKFKQLLICRDAYWKIADNWKPDWDSVSDKYTIFPVCKEIWRNRGQTVNTVLAFPTPEMR